MPSTYLSLHYHIIFGTKNRAPIIVPSWRSRFHEYLGGTTNGLGGHIQGVGGTADHVHLLVGLRSTHCLADFMRELKKATSLWVHEKTGENRFGWQERYGAFTVSPGSREQVRRYIADQEGHHRERTFREELVELLERAGVQYDARCLD